MPILFRGSLVRDQYGRSATGLDDCKIFTAEAQRKPRSGGSGHVSRVLIEPSRCLCGEKLMSAPHALFASVARSGVGYPNRAFASIATLPAGVTANTSA